MRRLIFGLVLFAGFSVHGYAQHPDIDLLRRINVERSAALDPAFEVLTNSAYPVCFSVPASCLATGIFAHDSTALHRGFEMVGGLAIATGNTALSARGRSKSTVISWQWCPPPHHPFRRDTLQLPLRWPLTSRSPTQSGTSTFRPIPGQERWPTHACTWACITPVTYW